MRRLIVCFMVSLSAACAGKYQHNLQFDSRQPIRVAVLPFVEVDDKGNTVTHQGSSSPPSVFLRRIVQNELRSSGLDILSPGLVDSNLSHNGFDDMKSNPPLNLDKIRNAGASELCTKVFSCDAVLYGKVSEWSQDYYGIQSVSKVALELQLVSAKDQKILFSASAEDSESRGLTKGPTGLSDLIIEPVRGLDEDIIKDLSRRMVKSMLKPLRVDSRPEFLDSAPPALFASAHDVAGGVLRKQQPMTVLAFGSPKKTASFSIGNIIENVPMVEKDGGHYIGKYFPLPNDSFRDQDVYVALTDQYGRTTRQKLGTSRVSIE